MPCSAPRPLRVFPEPQYIRFREEARIRKGSRKSARGGPLSGSSSKIQPAAINQTKRHAKRQAISTLGQAGIDPPISVLAGRTGTPSAGDTSTQRSRAESPGCRRRRPAQQCGAPLWHRPPSSHRAAANLFWGGGERGQTSRWEQQE